MGFKGSIFFCRRSDREDSCCIYFSKTIIRYYVARSIYQLLAGDPLATADPSSILKRQAIDDLQREAGETIIICGHAFGYLFHHGTVVTLDAAPQRVSQQLLGQPPGERVAVAFQNDFQRLWPVERPSVRERA